MYKNTLIALLLTAASLFSNLAQAENSQDFGDYVVHFNALSTSQLPPSVTREYKIKRSSSRGLINVAVLRKALGMGSEPVSASITASATNLTGQTRSIELREIREGSAIYYIGVYPITNEETLRFLVKVKPEGQSDTYEVRFKQQFFTQ